MLDDNSTGMSNENSKKGLGLPRVELQNYSSLQMGTTHNAALEGKELEHTGLLVYNVADEINKCKFDIPSNGIYVWDGTKWQGINAEHITSPRGKHQVLLRYMLLIHILRHWAVV